MKLSLNTLLLLQHVLKNQQLSVGDPGFGGVARDVLTALDELEAAIAEAQAPPSPE